ncbi:MAG: TonB-dependent receptor [Ignavibacteriales bacterium]|nr:MAG: TonB-dependent receptor [Ignavibacteriales bacterium]
MTKHTNSVTTLILMIWISLSVHSFLFAQNDTIPDIFQLSLSELGNIVITPSKFQQNIGMVTQKVDVLGSQVIQATVSGNRNLTELISRLPGAAVMVLSRNDANWGTYGGIGPKYSTYMLNGLTIDAFVDPMSLDVNAFERIEVQRGPASVMYPNFLSQDFAGNQSPLAGTVNLILREKIEDELTTASTAFGSYNTLSNQLYHQNSSGNLNYFAGSSYEVSQYTNYGAPVSWLNMKKNPEYTKQKLFGGATLFFGEDEIQKLSLFLHHTWDSGDKGRIYQGFAHRYLTVNTKYEVALAENLLLQSHLGVRSYSRSWQESVFGMVDMYNSENGVDQLIVPYDISISYQHHKNTVLSVGFDYQSAGYSTWSDPKSGYRVIGNKSSSFQQGIYIQEEWNPSEDLTLRGGIRYSEISSEYALMNRFSPNPVEQSWKKVLWSAGVRYRLSGENALFVNAGSSFAAPSLKSIAGTIPGGLSGSLGVDGQIPNPGLKSESGNSFDAGAEMYISSGFKLGVRGFYTIIRDAIIDNVVSLMPSQTQSMNTDNSLAAGGEAELLYKFSKNHNWFANITYMNSSTSNQFDADQDDSDIPFTPSLVANLGASFISPSGYTIIGHISYNDGFYDGTSKKSRTLYKPGVMVNLHLSRLFILENFISLEPWLQLYNITNNRFEMPWQFRNTGFSLMGGVKAAFR